MQLKYDDKTTYAEFETLANAMKDPPPAKADLDQYLKDEMELV